MKKYLNLILTGGSAFFCVLVFILGAAPAAKLTVFGMTGKSSFYDMLGDYGICVAILILLILGTLAALAALILPFVMKNDFIEMIASAAAALLLLITGILFFCVAPDGCKLAAGAVFCAIFSIFAAGASGANAFFKFKK